MYVRAGRRRSDASRIGPLAVATPGLVAGPRAGARALRHASRSPRCWRRRSGSPTRASRSVAAHARVLDVLAEDGARGSASRRRRASSFRRRRADRAGLAARAARSRARRCARIAREGPTPFYARPHRAARSRPRCSAQRRPPHARGPRALPSRSCASRCAAPTAASRCSRSRRRRRAASRCVEMLNVLEGFELARARRGLVGERSTASPRR